MEIGRPSVEDVTLELRVVIFPIFHVPLSTMHTHTHTHLTALVSETTQVSRYQKGKTNLDFTEARDSEWQWHQLGHI